ATFEQAQEFALENSLHGSSPMSSAARTILEREGDRAPRRLDEGTPFIQDLLAGNARLPFAQKDTTQANLGRLEVQDLEFTPTGGVLGATRRFFGYPIYDVTPRGMANDPRAPRFRVPAEEATAAIRQQNLLRDPT